ncbi:MAG TPA: magnesium transporter CorA family protein [Actinomycetes bacterium]|nr:magnesium transporter CorA family protein [Actinomycetes bacterium]
MVDVWEVRGQRLDHSTASAEQASRIAADPTSIVWLQVTPDEMRQMASALDLHPRAVEDVLQHTDAGGIAPQRTAIERFPQGHLLYLYRAQMLDGATLRLIDTPVLITHESMISVQREEPIDTEHLLERWERNPLILEQGVPALLWGLLDLVVDSYLDAMDVLSDAVDEMEDDLFTTSPTRGADPVESQMRSFATRKALVQLRRVAQPMREVVGGLMRHEENGRPSIGPSMQPYYQDVYDHVLRVNDTIEGLRDLITTIYETRLALNDHSLNTVTRQLAAWAAIIAVPTAVTGFYGQNIPYPGFAATSGFWTSTVIWVGLSLVLYVAFRRRQWL